MSRKQTYYLDVQKFPGPVVKEDLIGTYWKCYQCGIYEKITQDGITHNKDNHWQSIPLEQLFYYWERDNKLLLDILMSVFSRT